MRNLGDFPNLDCTLANIDFCWALQRLHLYVRATFDEQRNQDTLRIHGS